MAKCRHISKVLLSLRPTKMLLDIYLIDLIISIFNRNIKNVTSYKSFLLTFLNSNKLSIIFNFYQNKQVPSPVLFFFFCVSLLMVLSFSNGQKRGLCRWLLHAANINISINSDKYMSDNVSLDHSSNWEVRGILASTICLLKAGPTGGYSNTDTNSWEIWGH